MQRIEKILSSAGICSRRKAKELLAKGYIKINSSIAKTGDKASQSDKIFVQNKLIKRETPKIYLKLNKPRGYVTTLKPQKNEKSIKDLIKIKERVFPVGRLDKDSSGLILLTNDGDFANYITHPKYQIDKIYLVELDRYIRKTDLSKIEEGMNLKEGNTGPIKIKKSGGKKLQITIHKGWNRIIRRIFGKIGFTVIKLERMQIGKLKLGNLKTGRYEKIKIGDII